MEIEEGRWKRDKGRVSFNIGGAKGFWKACVEPLDSADWLTDTRALKEPSRHGQRTRQRENSRITVEDRKAEQRAISYARVCPMHCGEHPLSSSWSLRIIIAGHSQLSRIAASTKMRNEAAQDRLNHREKQRYLGCTRIVQSPLTLTETRKRYSCQLRNLDSPRSKCEIYLLIYLEADDDDLSGCMVNLIIRR